MSASSVKTDLVVPAPSRADRRAANADVSECNPEPRKRPADARPRFSDFRSHILETCVLLGIIVVLQRWCFGTTHIPGIPHPYWVPVLLASCQYGIGGGAIATLAASGAYLFEVPAPSATQDFYSYIGAVAIHPAVWLATALVIGGLRNLHISQSSELAEELAACSNRSNDLSAGLQRATLEIDALERRIAGDASTMAAMSHSISLIDMTNRWTATASFGDVFRVGAGVSTFTIYLRHGDGYAPALTVDQDVVHPNRSSEPISFEVLTAMETESEGDAASCGLDDCAGGRYVICAAPSNKQGAPLAVIVCRPSVSVDMVQFRRRANELGRALATILGACPLEQADVRR
jgi:hypothetical protein